MNKLSRMAIASAVLIAVSAPASAQQFLDNWRINPTGGGFAGAVSAAQVVNFDGFSFVQDTFTSASTFTFKDNGVFKFGTTDNGDNLYGSSPSDPFPNYEITLLFRGVTGTGTVSGTAGNILFTPNVGSLTIYSHNGLTFAELPQNGNPPKDGEYYGTNPPGAVPIGNFTIESGHGSIDPSGIPNGPITITFKNTSPVPAGYWFDENGVDLSTYPAGFLLAYTTTNASRTTNPPKNIPPELVCDLAGFNCVNNASRTPYVPAVGSTPCSGDGCPFDRLTTSNIYFVVANGGQFRLAQATPEPGTIALLGLGLAGLGLRRRLRRA